MNLFFFASKTAVQHINTYFNWFIECFLASDEQCILFHWLVGFVSREVFPLRKLNVEEILRTHPPAPPQDLFIKALFIGF